MNDKRLLGIGLGGFGITAVCCFTPLLVILVTTVGLSAVIGWLDYVLFPAMGVFVAITCYALWLRWRPQKVR